MKILLQGTGGADGVPAFYSDSRVSEYARQHRGKDIRTRTAALVDGILKIDLGPDTWHQVARDGLDARDWTALLFTHSDADHFAPDELMYSLYPFNDMEFAGFTIYANGYICRRLIEKYPDWPFEIVMTQSFRPFTHGGYLITPLHAHHKPDEDAHNFVIQDGDKNLLYGTDTGIWDEPTWEALAQFRLDCLILECSEGMAATAYDGHLDVNEFLMVLGRLREMGTVHEKTKILTTHHSHNGEATHQELVDFFAPHGVDVGYDGLLVEF
ncbi:MAG: MBL fold metallo-hydrolase [Fimbriimonadaceae bacterium]|jgi:phosphoribosyl 1,2-cyclic phosphate phosphodiesterase|nr:MBL fold metallo-hydrolase [Fimbriimonadaceae bacterium]